MDNIYNICSQVDDYINPTTKGNMSWWSICSCSYELGEVVENWRTHIYEVSMQKCSQIMNSLWWIGNDICDLTTYEGLPKLYAFLF